MNAHFIQNLQGRLRVTEHPVDPPAITDTQLLVKVRATPLNRGELLDLPLAQPDAGPGKRFGNEVAGEVVAVGANVSEFKPGDRVMGRCNQGGFADQAVMESFEAIPMPAHLDWAQAASIPLVFTVAYDMLRWQGGVGQGDAVLIAGISSGVGVASLLLAKAMGATVIGTSGNAAKLELLRAHGLDIALNTAAPGFAPQVLEATQGKGVKLAINVVGGSVFGDCLDSLALAGSQAIVGHLDHVHQTNIDLKRLHARRLSIFGVSNKHRTAQERAELVKAMRRDVMPFFVPGGIVPLIDRVVDAADLQQAIDQMQDNTHVGKLVATRGA